MASVVVPKAELKFKDIDEDKLVYTCNCGWIDRSHANPTGARELLNRIRGSSATPVPGEKGFPIKYGQSNSLLGIKLPGNPPGKYYVPYGLSADQQNSVALGIFQEGSMQFEAYQSAIPFSRSGFSQEDLVSNLVSFYAAARGEKADDLINRLCKRVSKRTAYEMMKRFGPPSTRKNYKFEPFYLDCPECVKECGGPPKFPSEFGQITPGTKGIDYSDWKDRPR